MESVLKLYSLKKNFTIFDYFGIEASVSNAAPFTSYVENICRLCLFIGDIFSTAYNIRIQIKQNWTIIKRRIKRSINWLNITFLFPLRKKSIGWYTGIAIEWSDCFFYFPAIFGDRCFHKGRHSSPWKQQQVFFFI